MNSKSFAVVCILVLSLTITAHTTQDTRPVKREKIDELINEFSGQSWKQAVDAIVEIGQPAVGPLIEVLRNETISPWSIHARAIESLSRIGTPRAVDAVVEALDKKRLNKYVRGLAAVALGNHDSDQAVQALIHALKDPDQFVRWKAVQSLNKPNRPDAADALILTLKDKDQYVRAAAVKSLSQKGGGNAPDALIGCLADEHWLVRFNARTALGDMGEPAARPLIAALNNSNNHLRWQVAWTLGKLEVADAIEPLAELLSDPDWMVRHQAAVSLTKIKSDRTVELLTEISKGGSANARTLAVWAIERIQNPNVTGPDGMPGEQYKHSVPRKAETLLCDCNSQPSLPAVLDSMPTLPSPCITSEGVEILILIKEGKYSLVPVTIENGKPLNYKERQWGKGRQLAVDSEDFPTLAATGLHSEEQLNQTMTITDRSIVEITELGRPERSSGAGFMAVDEDIISVLKGDNKLARTLGLTHLQMVVPLFHMWNLMFEGDRRNLRKYTEFIMYNHRKVEFTSEGSKGWQESIFDDEVLGKYQLTASRGLSSKEMSFLHRKYSHLSGEQMAEFVKKLSHINTGEMVPYYIMRYGFYEGHTEYRADPVAIAFIFGLRTLEQIEAAFEGGLYEALTKHFIKEKAGR